jgi:hypothetical protein
VTNTFPLFFSKLNRIAWHVNMPGGHALSAYGASRKAHCQNRWTDRNWKRHVCKIHVPNKKYPP